MCAKIGWIFTSEAHLYSFNFLPAASKSASSVSGSTARRSGFPALSNCSNLDAVSSIGAPSSSSWSKMKDSTYTVLKRQTKTKRDVN